MIKTNIYLIYICLCLFFLACSDNKSNIQLGKYYGLANGYDLTIELKEKQDGLICLNYICVINDGAFINESFSTETNAACNNIKNKVSRVKFEVINFRDIDIITGNYNRFDLTLEFFNDDKVIWIVDSSGYSLLPYLPHRIVLQKIKAQ